MCMISTYLTDLVKLKGRRFIQTLWRFGFVWRGQMRIITCRIGCISPRRQARGRRSLQTPQWSVYIFTNGTPPTTWPFSATTDWEKRDLTLWRFEVREKGARREIGFGVKGKGARPCKAWGMAKIHNVFSPVYFAEQSKSPPSPAAMKFAYPSANCPRNLSVVTDLPRGMGGTLPLALGHKSISQPKPLSPLST